jgi:hypothetical protein
LPNSQSPKLVLPNVKPVLTWNQLT